MKAHVFALTGSIGSGKSTVARIWREHGLAVVDADQVARQVVEPGTPGLAELVREFGAEILTESGELRRAHLGSLVFGDPERVARLNQIVHPLVQAEAARQFMERERAGHTLICYEVPLLFETGQEERFRPVVVVYASLAQCLERSQARDGVSRSAVEKRMAAQLHPDEKRSRADFVIENSGALADTERQALELLALLRQQFASQ